jgi:hypothetical protein
MLKVITEDTDVCYNDYQRKDFHSGAANYRNKTFYIKLIN